MNERSNILRKYNLWGEESKNTDEWKREKTASYSKLILQRRKESDCYQPVHLSKRFQAVLYSGRKLEHPASKRCPLRRSQWFSNQAPSTIAMDNQHRQPYFYDFPHYHRTKSVHCHHWWQCITEHIHLRIWFQLRQTIVDIEPQTGKVLQQKELSANLDVTSTPLVTEQEIVFGTADRGVFALDKSTLFNKWKAETSPSLVYTAPYSSTPQAGVETSPVASQGVVYIGASDGYLYAIDQATGIIKEKYNLGVPVFSTVAVSGNRMIVCDFAGNVYCFA